MSQVGIGSSWKNRTNSINNYFLADRNMHWIPVRYKLFQTSCKFANILFSKIGMSLFASNIGSGHFTGVPGSGAASGVGLATFEINAVFILIFLGWVFVPVYMSSEVVTMPEYLSKRFNSLRLRIILSVMSVLLYVFTKISADLYAGALFLKIAMGLGKVPKKMKHLMEFGGTLNNKQPCM